MAWRTIYFDANDGVLNSPSTLYYNTSGFWATAKSTGMSYRVYYIDKPTKSNYVFDGFLFLSGSEFTKLVRSDGYLYPDIDPGGDTTVYAGWRNYATITLSKGEYGSGGTSKFYYKLDGGGFYPDTGLTNAITSITPPTGGGKFGGYKYGDVLMIDANGNFTTALLGATISQDYTLTAAWIGGCVDYFGLGSATLVPFESDDGTNRPRVVTRHYGKVAGAEQTGPVWRNPSVKYMVVGDMTLSVTLGKAFAKKTGTINGPYAVSTTWNFGNHSGMTETGYMITEVLIETRHWQFPVVTVSAVANEGADAINQFAVSVPVSARARAQNLLGGISGGGHLQEVMLRAVCDPVILSEGPEPCASDAVNGRYELHAETLAANGEAAPSASGGFASTGEPAANAETEYTRYRLTAAKEIT